MMMAAAPDIRLPTRIASSRRWIALLALSMLLHIFTLDWAGGQINLLNFPGPNHTIITARLQAPAPLPKPAAPAPAPVKPTASRKKIAESHPVPVSDHSPDAVPNPDSAVAPSTPSESVATSETAGSGIIPETAAATAIDPPAQQPPATPAAAQETAPHYKTSPPPSAQLEYDVTRTESSLAHPYTGEAHTSWQLKNGQYTMQTDIGLSIPFGTLNLLTLKSEGQVNETGIMPLMSSQKRRSRSETATHFNRDKGTITFSASTKSYPLQEGAQDMATVPMQLAGIGRADAGQFKTGTAIDILVGEDREATLYSFIIEEQEQIDTKLGKFMAWHITRPPRPGSYNSRLDIWLAPTLNWYPIQIKNFESNGAVTTQILYKIVSSNLAQK